MPKLTIVAHITAGPDHAEFVKSELRKLIPPTLAEDGCLQYDLHQDNERPGHFMFYENWTSRDLWQRHMNSPHLAAYVAATDGMIESFTVHEMTPVD